jgi:hypothetical protein
MLSTLNLTQFNELAAQGYNRIPLVLEAFVAVFKIGQSTLFVFAGIGARW